MLLDVQPRDMLPPCVQELFRAVEEARGSAELPSCSLAGDRRLVSRLVQSPGAIDASRCAQPVLKDVSAATLAMVATWSSGGVAAHGT